jgi:hypothetical protein
MRETSAQHASFLDREWPAYVACILAFIGLTAAVLNGFNPYQKQNAGSDFKTLYASVKCFVHQTDAYTFSHLGQVFRDNGVVEPRSWYGHSPVYPPFTLALLAPLTALPMVKAIYVWCVFSAVCMGLAALTLLRAASRLYQLNLPLRLVLVGLIAASPLLEIGLELANVSVVSAALSIVAVALPRKTNPWIRALPLVIALFLKPHIALWICIALLFASWAEDRKVLWCTATITGALLALFGVWGLVEHFVLTQFSSYRQIVFTELSSGSMSAGNTDVMEIFVQITSLPHLVGYWLWPSRGAAGMADGFLLLIGASLVWTSLRSRQSGRGELILDAAAWSAFGLIATYHRDADAMILMLVLPFLLARLKANINDMWAWCVLVVVILGCVGPSATNLHMLLDAAPPTSVFRFLFLRQASIAALCLTLLLVGRAMVQTLKESGSVLSKQG